MASKTDEAVLRLLRKVEEKKEEIKRAKKKPDWETNCSIGFDPESSHDRLNIATIRKPSVLIDLYILLLTRQDMATRAATELRLPVDTKWLGYPIKDWMKDLQSRAAQLSVDQKKKELDQLDKRVNDLVSPDQRREMELVALEAELAD